MRGTGSNVPEETLVPVSSDVDIVTARQKGRELAARAGFSEGDQTVIAAAISELARNIVMYAKRGEVQLTLQNDGEREGLIVVARDQGPGIADLPRAMQDGYSTSGGLGLGLPGARRLMDDFEIHSQRGTGTTVTMKKWRRRSG
ncbi:MAG: anti-sigma regulatory factor [Gemmatimonadetes bacterium]|nr:anti-sigma regulatory factor [Gemmatimonadota bacterium]